MRRRTGSCEHAGVACAIGRADLPLHVLAYWYFSFRFYREPYTKAFELVRFR